MGLARCAKGAAMCDAATAVIGECGAIVRELVAPVRAEQGSAKAAWHAVARRLGMSPRRIRSWLNGEVRNVPAWEADLLREEARRAREERIARLEAELAALRLERVGSVANEAVGDGSGVAAATDLGRLPAQPRDNADLARGAMRARGAAPRPARRQNFGMTAGARALG